MTSPAAELDLLYSDVEDDLRASVRDLLADRADPAAVLARVETDQPYDPQLWRALAADLGLAGLLVPEARGGAGAGPREVAVVLEELGRAAAPAPFLGSAVLATVALLACGPDADSLVAALAAGERTGTLAVPFTTAPGAPLPARVQADGDGRLTGTITSVADLGGADVVLVPARSAGAALALYAVELTAETPRAAVHPVPSLDLTRPVADLELTGVPARVLATGPVAETVVQQALLWGAALLASDQLGVAQWCLDATVAYGKQRYQFARPIGSFQAVKHRLADVWAEVTTARAVARAAASALAASDEREAALHAALAQAYCADVAVHAAEECVQLHGGIGMTWEHPAHLYLGRAKAAQLALGTPDRHRATLAALIDLPA